MTYSHDLETRLEGADVKIEILKRELAHKEEIIHQYWTAIKSLRVVVGGLPENWQSKVSVGFSPVKCVEAIEDILTEITVDLPVWASVDDIKVIEEVATNFGICANEKKRGKNEHITKLFKSR